MIFLVVSTTIAASTALAVISYFPGIHIDNNNDKDRNLPSLSHAQSSTQANTTLILNLHKPEDQSVKDTTNYDITNISSNDTRLKDITMPQGSVSFVSITNDNMLAIFTLHMPDTTNPNKVIVKPAFIPFPIDSIETKADGNKIYHGKSPFMTITVGDNVPVGEEAILTETSPSQAQMTVFLK